MIKIWKGLEMEGIDKGIQTLFIKSENPSSHLVIKFLEENKDCTRLYLGAGRLDIKTCPLQIIEYCDKHFISVVAETTIDGLQYVSGKLTEYGKIIVRIQDPRLDNLGINDSIKIDTEENVWITKIVKMEYTNLRTLNNDVFENIDTILYEGEN